MRKSDLFYQVVKSFSSSGYEHLEIQVGVQTAGDAYSEDSVFTLKFQADKSFYTWYGTDILMHAKDGQSFKLATDAVKVFMGRDMITGAGAYNWTFEDIAERLTHFERRVYDSRQSKTVAVKDLEGDTRGAWREVCSAGFYMTVLADTEWEAQKLLGEGMLRDGYDRALAAWLTEGKLVRRVSEAPQVQPEEDLLQSSWMKAEAELKAETEAMA